MEEKFKRAKKLSNYIIEEPHIGEGSFGKVYTCYEQNNLKKPLACKCLNLRFYNSNPAYIRKLKDELRIMKTVNNSRVVKLIDLKRTEKDLFMIMEHVNGDNLDAFLQKYKLIFNQPPSMSLINFVASEASLGLYCLYKHSIIHRDIKLENLMFHFADNFTKESVCEDTFKSDSKFELDYNIINLDKIEYVKALKSSLFCLASNPADEIIKTYSNFSIWKDRNEIENMVMKAKIKIIDLGLSKDLSQEKGVTSSVCGSPITMAPEIWTNRLNKSGKIRYDYKVDIWSYGCCLYNLALGISPFASDEIDKICDKVMNEGKYWIPIDGDLTIEFIDFIEGMLQYDKNKRFNWEQIIEHSFISTPVSKQIRIFELVTKLERTNPDEANLLSNIHDSILIMSVHSQYNILKFGSKCSFLNASSIDEFKIKLTMLSPIEDFFYPSENRDIESNNLNDISHIFNQYETIEDYQFKENEDGFVIVDKNIQKIYK